MYLNELAEKAQQTLTKNAAVYKEARRVKEIVDEVLENNYNLKELSRGVDVDAVKQTLRDIWVVFKALEGTSDIKKVFTNLLEKVLNKLPSTAMYTPLKELAQKITQMSSEDEISKALITFKKILKDITDRNAAGELDVPHLPKPLKELAEDKNLYKQVENIVYYTDPKAHPAYRRLINTLEEQREAEDIHAWFMDEVNNMNIQEALKDSTQRGIKNLKIAHKASKDAFKHDVELNTSKEDVQKGIEYINEVFSKVLEKEPDLKTFFEKRIKELNDLGVEMLDVDLIAKVHTGTFIKQQLDSMYHNVQKIYDLISDYNNGNISPRQYKRWYIKLQNTIQDLKRNYLIYNNQLQKRLDPERVAYEQARSIVNKFRTAVPWIEEQIFPKRHAIKQIKARLEKHAPEDIIGLINEAFVKEKKLNIKESEKLSKFITENKTDVKAVVELLKERNIMQEFYHESAIYTDEEILEFIKTKIKIAQADKDLKAVKKYTRQLIKATAVVNLSTKQVSNVSTIEDLIDNITTRIDFRYEAHQRLVNGLDTVFSLGKLSKEARASVLNNIDSLQKLFQDEKALEIIQNVFNPEAMAKLNPAEQRIAIAFARVRDGLESKEMFEKAIDVVVAGVPKSKQREQLRNAIITTVQNLSPQDVTNIDVPQVTSQIVNSIQGYMNAFKLGRTPKSMDYLRKQYGLVTDKVDKVADALAKAGIVVKESEKEHSALYDIASQIMVWEHEHPEKTFQGKIMLDIETAGELDKYGNPTGAITEIAMMTRGDDGNLKIVANLRVQDTLEQARLMYTNTADVAFNMGLDPVDQVMKYVSDTEVITEADIVQQAYDILRNLPKLTDVHTYNGSRFDIPYLEARARTLQVGQKIKARDPKHLTDLEILEQQEKLSLPEFQEVIKRLKWTDDLAKKNKGLFVLDPNTRIKLEQAIADHIARQIDLLKYNKIVNETDDVIYAQKVHFFTEMGGTFIKDILEALQDDTIKTPILESSVRMQQGLDLSHMYDNIEGSLPLDDLDYEDLEIFEDPTLLTTRLKKLDLDTPELDPTIRKHLKDIRDDLLDTLQSIKFTHEYLRQFPVVEDIYNVRSKQFVQGLGEKMFDAWLKAQIEEGVDITEYTIGHMKNKFFTNLTAMLNFEGQTAISYKNFRPELLKLIDVEPLLKTTTRGEKYIPLEVREEIDNYLRRLKQEANRLKNYGVMQAYSKEAEQLLKLLKEEGYRTEFHVIKLDAVSTRESWAQLQVLWNRLNIDKNYYKDVAELEERIRKTHPELTNILDQRVAYFNLEWKATEVKWNTNGAKIDYRCQDYYHVVSQSAEMERLDKSLKRFKTYKTTEQAHKMSQKMINLSNIRKTSYTQGNATTRTAQYAKLGREFTDVMYNYTVYNKLTATPEELLSAILYNTPDRTMRIVRPLVDSVFNTSELFLDFLKRGDEFKAFGIKFKYDEQSRILELTLDEALDIRKSENATSAFRWAVNGREIEPVTYSPLSKDIFEKGYTRPIHQDYRDALYDAYQEIVQTDPRYAGRTGAEIVVENNQTVVEGVAENTLVDLTKNVDSYTPTFDESWIGSYTDLQQYVGPRYADAYYVLDSMATRATKHVLNKSNYAAFVVNTGFNLQDDLIKDIPLNELSAYLNKNPDLVVAYFKTDKHAIGGVVIDAVSKIDAETLQMVKDTGTAFIVPWETYVAASRSLNKFAYDNRLVESWYKLIQLYKKAWLMSPGVILRNAVDSTMKNFFEGGSPDETVKSYADAHKLLTQFDEISKQITLLDPDKNFRFDNIASYFVKNNTTMDKDTYMLVYQLMNDMGINTMYTMANGIFGAFMKPMTMIERVTRLAMFLNLQGQGGEYSKILRRIAETHFTYDLSDSLGYIKALLPFHTYTFSNLNYIIHLIEENPSILAHYLNTYAAMWNLDDIDQDELEDNVSLQYQLLNGNIPLSFFGYEDKEIERMVDTKYGPQLQKVKNTAVIKMGSSILDGLNSFINPYQSLMDKIAPPAKVIMDTMTEYLGTASGNFSKDTWYNYQEAENQYERGVGSVSLQRMFEDPTAILDVLPIADAVKQRFFHKEGDQYKFGSTTGQRTQNPVLDVLSMAGITGATSRWGEFEQRPKQSYRSTKRTPATYSYTNRYAKRNLHSYNRTHSNYYHRVPANIKTIPQYLFSNMGRTSRGKSKTMMWLNMNTRNRVKFMTKRYAGVNSFYR